MHSLGLLLLLHVLVVAGFVVARALHSRLSPLPALDGGIGGGAVVDSALPAFASVRQIEEYVEAGVADLRIMLIQAARRRHD